MNVTQPPPAFLKGVRVFSGGKKSPGLGRPQIVNNASTLAPPGDWAEFGVMGGKSATIALPALKKGYKFFLLDCWDGLPEDFVVSDTCTKPKGRFACEVPTFKDSRVVTIKGLYRDTMEDFQSRTDHLTYIHIDCDLYTSTVDALEAVTPMVKEGTIINFDELWGFDNWEACEWKALQEWTARENMTYKWIARSEVGHATMRVL